MNACRSTQSAGICWMQRNRSIDGWINRSAGDSGFGRKTKRARRADDRLLTFEMGQGGRGPSGTYMCISHRNEQRKARPSSIQGLYVNYFCVVCISSFAMLQHHDYVYKSISSITSCCSSQTTMASRSSWASCVFCCTYGSDEPTINKLINQSAHPKPPTHLGQPLKERAQRLARAEAF